MLAASEMFVILAFSLMFVFEIPVIKAECDEWNTQPPPPITTSSRIAIVGGGAGGAHMAYQLKKRGYQDITLFEEDSEVGGKAISVTPGDDRSPIGTGVATTAKSVKFWQFLRELNLTNKITRWPAVNSTRGLYSARYDDVVGRDLYLHEKMGGRNPMIMKAKLELALRRYSRIYFRIVDRETMIPKRQYRQVLAKPFMKFLDDIGLGILKFSASVTLRFGLYTTALENYDISTYSALQLMHPKLIQPIPEAFGTTADFSWDKVWKTAVEKADINLKLNTRCQSVEYSPEKDVVNITFESTLDGAMETREFDFCVFAIPKPLRILKNPTYRQRNILDKYNDFTPSVTFIYETDNMNWTAGNGYVFDDESKFIQNGILQLIMSRKSEKTSGPYFDIAIYRLASFIQEEDLPQLKATFLDQVEFLTESRPTEIVNTIVWNTYFPKCSAQSISDGVPWQLIDIQGENRMWFTSAFASFDLMQAIIHYNHMLLDTLQRK